MTIKTIHVRGGGILPVPGRSFENSRAEIEYVVSIEEGDDPDEVVDLLMDKATEFANQLHERLQASRG